MGRQPAPSPVAPPDPSGRRSKLDSEHPQPLAEAIVLTGPFGEHTLTAERTVIGRAPSCQVVIADPLVSREHALLRIGSDDVYLEDLRSANGVYVNGVRIREPRQLCDGDRILVGTQELAVFALSSPEERLAPHTERGECPPSTNGAPPPTERLDPAAVLGRAAQKMLVAGAPREAERILDDYLRSTLDAARSGRTVSLATCDEAAGHALALATALGKSYWFDYAVDLYYQARLPMSSHIVAALAGAAVVVPAIDRALLGRYASWLRTSLGSRTEQQEGMLSFLEALGWGRL